MFILNYRLLYSSDVKISVIGYSDANYAGNVTTRSTIGYASCFGKGLVAWCSQGQKSVSLYIT